MMISLLFNAADIDNVVTRIQDIIRQTVNLDAIECIMGVSDYDVLQSLKEKLKQERSLVRIIIKLHGQLIAKDNLHQMFTFYYQYTHADSHIVIPVMDSLDFGKAWDNEIRAFYQNYTQQLGHTIFLFSWQEHLIYMRNWLDITGGFGLITDMTRWAILLNNALPETCRNTFTFNHDSSLSAPQENDMLGKLIQSIAASLLLHINRARRKHILAASLNKMDLIETANYIAAQYPVREACMMPLTRHIIESSTYVIGLHTIALLRIILGMILYKRGIYSKAMFSEKTLPYLDNWHMKEMSPINEPV